MYQNEIILSTKEILEKEFKLFRRGYRREEVDNFFVIILVFYYWFFVMVDVVVVYLVNF